MSIYVVRPREMPSRGSVAIGTRKLDPSSRISQVGELFSLNMLNPVHQAIQSWLQDAASSGVVLVATPEHGTPVTGAAIVEMPEETAERMRRELPDVLVLPDQPFHLISPRRFAAPAKERVTASDLWHLKAIGLEAARKRGFTGLGSGVTGAVLDTGIDATHPELQGKLAGAYTLDTANKRIQPMSPPRGTEGHGTYIAGLICGAQVGVAPGANVVSVVLPEGRGYLSDFLLALEWVGGRPDVQILTMAAGIPGYQPDMQSAVAALLAVGVLPIFAIGNEGRNSTRSPANAPEVLSVGAVDQQNRVAAFSGGGMLTVESHRYSVPNLVAPGVDVYSCVMGGGYEAWSGTGAAAAIVSGVAALLLESYPDIWVTDLIEEILAGCMDLSQPPDRQGDGLVQVEPAPVHRERFPTLTSWRRSRGSRAN